MESVGLGVRCSRSDVEAYWHRALEAVKSTLQSILLGKSKDAGSHYYRTPKIYSNSMRTYGNEKLASSYLILGSYSVPTRLSPGIEVQI